MALRQLTNILIRTNKWLHISPVVYKHINHRNGGQNNSRNERLDEVRRQCFPNQNEYSSEETDEINENDEVEQVMSTPADGLEKKTVRIYRRCRYPSQQMGTKASYLWEIDYDSSEGDDDEHLKLEFPSAQAAINFVNKHRWEWSLDSHQIYPYEPKSPESLSLNTFKERTTEY